MAPHQLQLAPLKRTLETIPAEIKDMIFDHLFTTLFHPGCSLALGRTSPQLHEAVLFYLREKKNVGQALKFDSFYDIQDYVDFCRRQRKVSLQPLCVPWPHAVVKIVVDVDLDMQYRHAPDLHKATSALMHFRCLEDIEMHLAPSNRVVGPLPTYLLDRSDIPWLMSEFVDMRFSRHPTLKRITLRRPLMEQVFHDYVHNHGLPTVRTFSQQMRNNDLESDLSVLAMHSIYLSDGIIFHRQEREQREQMRRFFEQERREMKERHRRERAGELERLQQEADRRLREAEAEVKGRRWSAELPIRSKVKSATDESKR